MIQKPRLGLVGLGIMGGAIARRLLGRGWQLTVWDLEPERFQEVEKLGARWADGPAAVRKAADIVLICVLGDQAIEAVCFGPAGLSGGQGADTVIDLSTTGLEVTRNVAGRLDVDWLDCPISGGPGPAEEGKLTLMAGGDPVLFGRLKPLLDEFSTNCTLMGPLGAGQVTKIVNQAIVGVNYVLMGEILAMVQAAGIDPARLPHALQGGAADSFLLQRIFPVMVDRDFNPPKGRAGQLSKDLQAVAAFNETRGLELPVLARAIAQYVGYAEAGNADRESASVSRLYDRREEP